MFCRRCKFTESDTPGTEKSAKKKKKKKISKETVSDTLAQFLFLIKMIDDGNDLNLSEFDHSLVLVVFLLVQVSAPTCFS